MKQRFFFLLILVIVSASFSAGTTWANDGAGDQRYIVRTSKDQLAVEYFCWEAGCDVQSGLDGTQGHTYLVTSSNNLVNQVVDPILNKVAQTFGIQSVEADQRLPMPGVPLNNMPAGLYDTAPVNYFGTVVWHGYAAQPAAQIIRLTDAQNGFRISGGGIVAVIDTGVDPNHPVLRASLVPGFDFTRNQAGASEWLDISSLLTGPVNTSSQNQQPVLVQQSTAAVLDQSTAAVLDGQPYSAFGHGTMTAGLVHLVAPKAKILPLKAFSSDGTGYLSNILAALYYAVQHYANVVNMSFDLTTSSPALAQAVSDANRAGVILVAAAGNESTNAPVYPAALNGFVMGIASTSIADKRSSFSNFGPADVWLAAPGENIVSTYPGGTYASASGTSFSSPLVAGTAALLFSAKQPINQTQAANALKHGRLLTPDLNNGRLDVYQAVTFWLLAH